MARCRGGSPDSVIARSLDIGDSVGRMAVNSIALESARWGMAPWGIGDQTSVDGQSARVRVSIGLMQSVMMQIGLMATVTRPTAPSSSRRAQALASIRWDVPAVPASTALIGIARPSIGCRLATSPVVMMTIPAAKKVAATSLLAEMPIVRVLVVRMGRHLGNIATATVLIAIARTMGRTDRKISAISSETVPRYLESWPALSWQN